MQNHSCVFAKYCPSYAIRCCDGCQHNKHSSPTATNSIVEEFKRQLFTESERSAYEDLVKSRATDILTSTPTHTVTIENKENIMKNVLFLAPAYAYAKATVTNIESELNQRDIPFTRSLKPGNVYIKTDDVHIEFTYVDPLKYTPDMFLNRDAIFGKKAMIEKAISTFPHIAIRKPKMSLNRYIREAYESSKNRGLDKIIIEEAKPRTTYLPEITHVYFNDPVTVVMWADGTKTIVRCQDGDVYSKETGLALCVTKKAFGNEPNFNNLFRKWMPMEKEKIETPVNIKKAIEEIRTFAKDNEVEVIE